MYKYLIAQTLKTFQCDMNTDFFVKAKVHSSLNNYMRIHIHDEHLHQQSGDENIIKFAKHRSIQEMVWFYKSRRLHNLLPHTFPGSNIQMDNKHFQKKCLKIQCDNENTKDIHESIFQITIKIFHQHHWHFHHSLSSIKSCQHNKLSITMPNANTV
jgi:hypothetical protein